MRIISRYLDSLVDPLFATDEGGNRIFYPGGVLARGRVLPNAEYADGLRRRVKTLNAVVFAILIPALTALGALRVGWRTWAMATVAGLFIGLLQQMYYRYLVRGLPVAATRLTFATAWRSQASALGRGWLRALFAVSIMFVAAGLAISIFDQRMLLVGTALVVMFGLCAIVFWRQLRMLGSASPPVSR